MSGKKFCVSFWVGLTVLVLLFNMNPGFAGYAEAAVKRAVATTNGVNVRSGPGTGFKKIGMINKGASYDVVEQKNGWARLKISSNTLGWVIESFLKIAANSVVSQPAETVKTIVVKADNVNLRSGPGVNFAKVSKANKGQRFLATKESGGWYYVGIGQGKFGWIIGQFVSVQSSAAKTNPPAGQNTGAKPTPASGSSGGVVTAKSTLVITGSIVNVRAGAGTGFGIVTKVKAGERFTVLKNNGQWYLVQLTGGRQGWIAGWLAKIQNTGGTGTGTSTGQTPADSGSGGDTVGKTLVVKGDTVNVRTGAGTGFSIVTKVKAGDRFTVLKSNGEWYMVQLTGGRQGWVAGWLTQVDTSNPTSRDGTNPSKPPETPPKTPPETPPGTYPGTQPGTQPGTYPGTEPGTQPGTEPGTQPGTYPGTQPGTYPGTQPGTNPGTQPETGTPQDSGEGQGAPVSVAKLQSIELTGSAPAEEQLIIKSEGDIKFNVSSLDQPNRLVIDLANSDVNNIKDFAPGGGLVSNVRVAQYSLTPMVVRVVLDLTKTVSCTPVVDESGKVLTIKLTEPSIKGKVIVVDAGHGGYDPGAIGVTGLNEKDFNLDLALRVRDKLTAAGATVIMTREDDTFVSLTGRANVANQVYADVFVSIHANASNSSAQRGTSTYFYAPSGNPVLYAERESRQRLASKVQDRLINALGTRDIGILQANFAVLRETLMPSILVESAFLSNAEDEALLKDSQFREREAQAIADGLCDYFAL